jgi:hypothetical protein
VWSELRERVAQYDSRTSNMRLRGGGASPSVEARNFTDRGGLIQLGATSWRPATTRTTIRDLRPQGADTIVQETSSGRALLLVAACPPIELCSAAQSGAAIPSRHGRLPCKRIADRVDVARGIGRFQNVI